MAIAAWQLLFGWLMLAAGMLIFEGVPQLWPLPTHVLAWIAYNGLIGMGLAYFLWFVVVGGCRRPPRRSVRCWFRWSASSVRPVVGERPSLNDIVGFAWIFAAAACVLLQPNVKHTEMPER